MDLLKGIKVLDLADEKASFCSKLLADLGAEVIKVERPGGDPSRKIGPFAEDYHYPENSLLFFHNNTNKLGITLNLEHEDGKKIFHKLLQRTDIVVESFAPGYLKQQGLGFEVLATENSKLIMVSVTGFGENGPRRDYKSCDLVASAVGGQTYVTGSQSTPLKPFGEQSYSIASLFGAISILLALRKRVQTGKGEHIDISLQEAVVSALDHVMVRYFYENTIPKRQGGVSWNRSFFVLSCKEGHILLAPFQQWETLVEWMDNEGMAGDLKDEKYHEEAYRNSRMDHILQVMEQWTRTHTAQELFESGQLMRFPWAPVSSLKEVLNSPQLKARDFFVDVKHPEMKKSISYAGSPYKFSHAAAGRWRRAPLIGEDNFRIYQKELGLSSEEFQRLSSLGVI